MLYKSKDDDARPQVFNLISTDHGTMIINRNDFKVEVNTDGQRGACGVGFQLLTTGNYESLEINFCKHILRRKFELCGKGIVAIDCGANIGIHTIEYAKLLNGVGRVISFEPQEPIYYALCGNIALNNCFNVRAYNVAVGNKNEQIDIPKPNYLIPSSFGSLELKQKVESEDIGQKLTETTQVDQICIDALNLDRLDFIKIDVEGMEFQVLEGGMKTIANYSPIMWIELLKIDKDKMIERLQDIGYDTYLFEQQLLAIHQSDKFASIVSVDDNQVKIR